MTLCDLPLSYCGIQNFLALLPADLELVDLVDQVPAPASCGVGQKSGVLAAGFSLLLLQEKLPASKNCHLRTEAASLAKPHTQVLPSYCRCGGKLASPRAV